MTRKIGEALGPRGNSNMYIAQGVLLVVMGLFMILLGKVSDLNLFFTLGVIMNLVGTFLVNKDTATYK